MEQVNKDEGVQVTEAETEALFITEEKAKQMEHVTNMDRIGDIIGNWHNQSMNTLNHVLSMPRNVDPENPELGILVLDPKHPNANEQGLRPLNEVEWDGFMFGITYARDLIEDFPLKFVPLDADGKVTPEYASVEEDNTGGDNAPEENKG